MLGATEVLPNDYLLPQPCMCVHSNHTVGSANGAIAIHPSVHYKPPYDNTFLSRGMAVSETAATVSLLGDPPQLPPNKQSLRMDMEATDFVTTVERPFDF